MKFWVGFWLAMAALAIASYLLREPPKAQPQVEQVYDEYDFAIQCREMVEERLKAPATAVFPNNLSNEVEKSSSLWLLVSHVDSENSFGANLRTKWVCSYDPSTEKVSIALE
jgi:hypothetical protein